MKDIVVNVHILLRLYVYLRLMAAQNFRFMKERKI